MTEIETGRLLLRHWREEDLDPCADPEIMQYTRAGSPLTRERTEQRVTATIRHREERDFGLWAVEEKATGAFISRIGLLYHEDWPEGEHKRRSAGCSTALSGVGGSPPHPRWRACASVSRSSDWSASISIIRPENAASRQVAEKAGLTFRGETRWRGMDVVWYTRDRSDWEAAQADA
jgi:RimJ/RimL family protein N-acetyltransferase